MQSTQDIDNPAAVAKAVAASQKMEQLQKEYKSLQSTAWSNHWGPLHVM